MSGALPGFYFKSIYKNFHHTFDNVVDVFVHIYKSIEQLRLSLILFFLIVIGAFIKIKSIAFF